MKTTANKPQLIRKFHAIIGSGEYSQVVKDAIKDDYGVESIKQLTKEELQNIIKGLQGQIKQTKKNKTLKKLRSTALTIATDALFPELSQGNYDRFNKWMIKSSVYHKELHKHTKKELQKLIKQFKAVEGNSNTKKQLLNVCLN